MVKVPIVTRSGTKEIGTYMSDVILGTGGAITCQFALVEKVHGLLSLVSSISTVVAPRRIPTSNVNAVRVCAFIKLILRGC